jgi:hypothetical protein
VGECVHVIKTSQFHIYSFFVAQPNALLHSVTGRLGSAMAKNMHQQLPLPSQQEKLRGCASGEGQGSAWDDFYHLYDAKLNRCVFNDSQGHDCVFFKKKMGPNYRYKKCTGRGLVRYK